jgi:hypothetical protein
MKLIFNIKSLFVFLIVFTMATSCVKDLDTIPIDEDVVTSGVVFDNPESYRQVLAKLYAGLALSGQQGPAGQADIEGIDEGFGQYLRGYWYHQELPTDEAVIGWNDQTIKDFHDQTWTASDGFIFAHYSRIFYQIVICSEFLRETSDSKLSDRGVDEGLRNEIQGYRAEARFLRALSYWHALDLFRNVPFVTEEDKIGSFFPEQINGPDLFNFIESELLDIENKIAAVRTNEYARADQGAVWTLLAKLYQNAQVYTGTERNAECLEYCQKVISAGYTLEPNYRHLFLADNHKSEEVIFPVAFDGIKTRTWGGTTFIIRAGIGGSMLAKDYGVASGWAGTRTTRQMVEKFPQDIGEGGVVIARNLGETTTYPRIYVPGAHQGWNPSDNFASITSPQKNNIFEGYKYFSDDNSPFLFTLIPSFSQTLGDNGGDGSLEINGDTIRTGEAGLYRIEVNLNTGRYTLDRMEWGIIGPAASGDWDMDIDMVWNESEKALEANLTMSPGPFKFRANDDWVISLGDDAGDGILTQDGPDIMLEKGGGYQVLLYLGKPDYSFEIRATSFDIRGVFHSDGQNLDINDLSLFTEGYAIGKFKNITSEGIQGSDSDHPDTDFPMFRLGDVLLMASEAIIRGNGDKSLALEYFNRVRTRAYGGATTGHISESQLNLDMILDERARELYWECHRRTDLIRHGKFSETDYTWQWKGGVMEGKSVESFRDVFPIPSADIGANPNLQQNTGY